MDGCDIPPLTEPLFPPLNPLDAGEKLCHLHLKSTVSKSQDCSAALLSAGMGSIHNRFSLEVWIHMYTDGSEIEMDGVAGTGIYCELFAYYRSLGTSKSAFCSEIEPIKMALEHLDACLPFPEQRHVVIVSDSQAAILDIANCLEAPDTMCIAHCRSLIGKMRNKYKAIVL